MKLRFLFLLAATAAIVSFVFAEPIQVGSLSGSSDGSNITIRWVSEDEAGVLRFEIERRAGVSGQFFLLSALPLRGNNSSYEYIDETAYRVAESVYQYQVKVVYTNGSAPAYYGPITVRHSVSSVRRTWGSIKAMFR